MSPYPVLRIPNYEHEAHVLAERRRMGIPPRLAFDFPWQNNRSEQHAR